MDAAPLPPVRLRPAEDRAANAIERALDDLHVDLLLLGSGDAPQRIDEVAMKTGVLL